MSNESVYKEVLLDHFHNPRNKGDLDGMEVVNRGSNPRCGDEIEVGVNCEDDTLTSVRFRGRGCSVCQASASIMTESISGLKVRQAQQLTKQMQQWFNDENSDPPDDNSLAALSSLRQHSARKKCVLLAWIAIDEILGSQSEY